MNRIAQKLIAAALCAGLAVTLTSCRKINNPFVDTSYVMRTESGKIAPGVYIYSQFEALGDAQDKFIEEHPDVDTTEDGFSFDKYKVEGKEYTQWVKDRALLLTARLLAAEKMFDERGLSFTPEEELNLAKNAENKWNTDWYYDANANYYGYYDSELGGQTWGELYESSGISEESFKFVYKASAKESKIFESLYGKDGTEAVSDAEWQGIWQKDYARYRRLTININNDEGETVPEAELAELAELGEGYAARLANGEGFTKIKKDYQRYLDEKNGVESEEEPDEEEPDETLNDYFTKRNEENKVVTRVFEMELNKPELFKDETAYYVLERLDVLEREDLYDSYRNTIVHGLKDDEFKATMESKAGELLNTVTVNQAAFKRYDPKNLS